MFLLILSSFGFPCCFLSSPPDSLLKAQSLIIFMYSFTPVVFKHPKVMKHFYITSSAVEPTPILKTDTVSPHNGGTLPPLCYYLQSLCKAPDDLSKEHTLKTITLHSP